MTDFDPRRRLDDDHITNQTDRMRNWQDRPRPIATGTADFNLRGGTNPFGGLVVLVVGVWGVAVAAVSIYGFFAQNWPLLIAGAFLIAHLVVALILNFVLPKYFTTTFKLLMAAVCSGIAWYLVAVIYDNVKNGIPFRDHFNFTLQTNDPFGPFVFLIWFLVFIALFSLLPFARRPMTALRAIMFAHILGIASYVSLIGVIFAVWIGTKA